MCDKLEEEIKDLRAKMIRRAKKRELLDDKVVEINQSLDEKIVEKMKMKRAN